MTFQEALEELGVGRDASADEARRAYLKLLKTRRPETDAQGFMRLREAFDQVKGAFDARDAIRRLVEARAAEAAPAPPPALASRDAGGGPAVHEAPAPAPAAPEGPARETQAPDAGHESAEEGARESAEEGARESADEGAHDAAAVSEGEGERPPSEAEVDRLLAAGDREAASLELERVFDVAARTADGVEPPFGKAVRLLLELHERAALGAASRLEASVVAWLHASGQEVRVLRRNAAVAWGMTRELGALRGKFPKKARAAIARGLRTGDLGKAQAALVALRQKRPEIAEDAAGRLRVSSPLLAQQFANVLDPPAPSRHAETTPGSPRGSARWPFWILFTLVMPLVRMLAGSTTTPPYRDPASIVEDRMSARRTMVIQRAGVVSALATQAAPQDGVGLSAGDYRRMDAKAKAVAEEARWGRCSGAWDAMGALEVVGKSSEGATQAAIAALRRTLTDLCGDPAPEIVEPPAAPASADAAQAGAGPKAPKGKGTAKKP